MIGVRFFPHLFSEFNQKIQKTMGVTFDIQTSIRDFLHVTWPSWMNPHQRTGGSASGVYHDRRDPDESVGKREPPSATSAGLRSRLMREKKKMGNLTPSKDGQNEYIIHIRI